MHSRKRVIPAIISATLIGTGAAITGAQAASIDDSASRNTMDQMQDSMKEAKAKAADATEKAKDKAEKAGDKAESYASDAKDKAEDYASETESAVRDAWLNGKLDTALLLTSELDSFAIDTKVENGTAHLTGTVGSDVERDLAYEIAQSIEGLDSIENRLEVREDGERSGKRDEQMVADDRFRNAVESAALTARIKSELLVNTNVSGLSINVDSSREDVTLNGAVDSEASKKLAEQIAQNAANGRTVKNNLRIEGSS